MCSDEGSKLMFGHVVETRQRHMRRELAALRLQSDAAHQPFVLGLQFHHRRRRPEQRDERARPASAERRQPVDAQFKAVAAYLRQDVLGIPRGRIVDVDFGKNLPVSKEIIKPFGGITCYASTSVKEPAFPYNDLLRLNVSVRPVFVYTMSDEAKRAAHADIARWLAETNPVFAIAERYALKDVVAAHLAVERGEKIGHVILTID